MINNNLSQSFSYTNYKLRKTKTFQVKNLLNNLLTISQLHKYYPNIIKTKQCIFCDQSDDSIHWLFCPNPQLIFDIIKSNIQFNFTTSNLDVSSSQLLHLQNSFINYHSLQLPQPFSNNISLHQTITGLIPNDLIQLLYLYTDSHKSAHQLITSLFIKISESIHEQLWKPYCAKLSEWKQTNNIKLHKQNSQANNIQLRPLLTHNHSNSNELLVYVDILKNNIKTLYIL